MPVRPLSLYGLYFESWANQTQIMQTMFYTCHYLLQHSQVGSQEPLVKTSF